MCELVRDGDAFLRVVARFIGIWQLVILML